MGNFVLVAHTMCAGCNRDAGRVVATAHATACESTRAVLVKSAHGEATSGVESRRMTPTINIDSLFATRIERSLPRSARQNPLERPRLGTE